MIGDQRTWRPLRTRSRAPGRQHRVAHRAWPDCCHLTRDCRVPILRELRSDLPVDPPLGRPAVITPVLVQRPDPSGLKLKKRHSMEGLTAIHRRYVDHGNDQIADLLEPFNLNRPLPGIIAVDLNELWDREPFMRVVPEDGGVTAELVSDLVPSPPVHCVPESSDQFLGYHDRRLRFFPAQPSAPFGYGTSISQRHGTPTALQMQAILRCRCASSGWPGLRHQGVSRKRLS